MQKTVKHESKIGRTYVNIEPVDGRITGASGAKKVGTQQKIAQRGVPVVEYILAIKTRQSAGCLQALALVANLCTAGD